MLEIRILWFLLGVAATVAVLVAVSEHKAPA